MNLKWILICFISNREKIILDWRLKKKFYDFLCQTQLVLNNVQKTLANEETGHEHFYTSDFFNFIILKVLYYICKVGP